MSDRLLFLPLLRPIYKGVDMFALNRSTRNNIFKGVLGHTFAVYSYRQMVKFLPKEYFNRDTTSQMRTNVMGNFDIHIRLKLAVFKAAQTPNLSGNRLKDIFVRAGLTENDTVIYYWVVEQGLLPAIRKKINKVKIPHPNKISRNTDEIIRSIDTYTKKYVYRKLKFMVTSNNMEYSDLVNDLMIKGITTYYGGVPFKSELHLFNLVKNSIKNYGINMMAKSNAKKRARLQVDEEGKWHNIIQTDTMKDAEGRVISIYDKVESNVPEMALLEFKLSLSSLISRLSENERKVIGVILNEDESFLSWYNKEYKCNFESNVELCRHLTKKNENYLNVVCTWAKVPKLERGKLATVLKRELIDG